MSKSIVIQEGGIGKQLTVDKLNTDLVGGGTCLWIPEDEINLGTKSVSENGTYKAEDDGYTGYSQVHVNVSGGGGGGGDNIVGRDSDGNEVVATKDPNTDVITVTKIPSSIEVITPPTNPYGTYIDGQTITKDGMVVKAYDANGNEMQVVSIGEITINPTTAVYDESKDQKRSGTATSDLIDGTINIYNGQGYAISSSAAFTALIGLRGITSVDAAVRIGGQTGTVTCIVASESSPFDYAEVFYQYNEGPDGKGESHTVDITRQTNGIAYTHDGKTVYYNALAIEERSSAGIDVFFPNASASNSNAPELAWAMVYGDTETTPAGSPQTIAVSWPRPGDGKQLDTTFDIKVGPRAGQGDD